MSAVVGIFYLDGQPVEGADLVKMLDSLSHRGSDGSGTWKRGPLGLGHVMQWTTPESLHERLPFVDEARQLVITADARIDNRDELVKVLRIADCPAEMISDSMLILASYEKWGERCVDRLLGDFAFAIWDAATNRFSAPVTRWESSTSTIIIVRVASSLSRLRLRVFYLCLSSRVS
jgi:asparagine synthase (glutamine-hydrolysing)